MHYTKCIGWHLWAWCVCSGGAGRAGWDVSAWREEEKEPATSSTAGDTSAAGYQRESSATLHDLHTVAESTKYPRSNDERRRYILHLDAECRGLWGGDTRVLTATDRGIPVQLLGPARSLFVSAFLMTPCNKGRGNDDK